MGLFQYTYNGLTIGADTDFPFVRAEGLDTPQVRTGDIDRPNAHGLYPGSDFAAGRTVTLSIELAPTAPLVLADLLSQLGDAFTIGGPELPLAFQLPGQAARRINCRCRRIGLPVDQAFAIGSL